MCLADNIMTATFTNLCTSMHSGPTELSKERHVCCYFFFKSTVVPLVKKFPVFYGTQKFITVQQEQVWGYVHHFRIHWVILVKILSFAPFHDAAGCPWFRGYLPHLQLVPFTRNMRTRHVVVAETLNVVWNVTWSIVKESRCLTTTRADDFHVTLQETGCDPL